jgi:hypothetical protein
VTIARTGAGAMDVRVAMAPGAIAAVDLRASVAVADATLDGRPAAILRMPRAWTHLRWRAAPTGLSVAFRPRGHGTLEVRYALFQPGWPPGAAPPPPMPAEVMAWDLAGSGVVAGSSIRAW